ncbi:MEDS domain-containing protein [Mycobacterium xenopi]|uniref:MEDS domain-containing protein n=1 Tax=Mycobacterium xenopi TaxID=1789 RepID=UPI0022EB8EE5|nr:MEDS domain-containing protein [Mycobacterium xenopi]MDA3639032.1 MEDS domain-containing protein [Mycobacterium xenopi]
MRPQGVVTSAAGLTPFGHVGWGYRDESEFLARAAEYIADGLALNQRILYARDRSRAALHTELLEMGFGSAVRSRQISVTPVAEHYVFVAGTDVVDPEATVAAGVAAMEYVVAMGCSGCRAVVDGAVLARTPEQCAAFSCLEYLVDQKMAVLPFSALCAYNLTVLGEAAKEMLCLHPLVGKRAVGFRLYAEPGTHFALAGEIDVVDRQAFTAALQRIWPLAGGEELIIDARWLDFVTHRELLTLDEQARAHGRQVVLISNQQMLVRLVELLELESVRLDRSGAVDAG